MSRTQPTQLDSAVVAAVHRAGGTCRVVVASRGPAGPRVMEAVEFPETDAAGLRACLERHRVDHVIGVLPASSVVCRTCTLPNAEPDALDEALRLQAEAHLPPETPEYRWAMSVLPAAAGETSRSGIVLSWPESATVQLPPLEDSIARDSVRFTPDVAALAALLNGQRPDDPLVWIDRSQGSVAFAVTHAGGAIFRATREDLSDQSDWQRAVTRALAETALSVGHTGAFAEALTDTHGSLAAAVAPGGAALMIPDTITASAAGRLDGAGAAGDEVWWSRFGVAAGAILAAAGPLGSLTTMQAAADADAPSRLRAIAGAMSKPRGATITVMACLLLAAATPAVMAGLRLGLLRMRYPDIEEQTQTLQDAEEQLAIYGALEGEAWSTTKLLSDIVTNTPEGIELASIRLMNSDRTFSVTGIARKGDEHTASQALALMQQHLSESRIFSEIRLNWDEPNRYGQLEFELSAKITNPQWRPTYEVERDFGQWSLARRQANQGPPEEETNAGEPGDPVDGSPPTGAVATETGAVATETDDVATETDDGEPEEDVTTLARSDDGEPPPDARRRARPVGPGAGPGENVGRRSETDDRTGAKAAGPGAIPAPLTEAQIAAMNKAEIQDHLRGISAARRRLRSQGDDPALSERLKSDFDALMARLRELP